MVQLQFSTTRTAVAWLIRTFTWSDFSHVDFVLPDGRLLGARHSGGVQIRDANYEAWSRTERFTVDALPSVVDYALAQIGKPYDLTAVTGILFHRDWTGSDSWFCSELVAAAFEHGGRPLLRAAHLNRVTPELLLLSPELIPA